MATMRDIRRRIRTVRNIEQITKALKMVASARLQRAMKKASAAKPYSDGITTILSHLLSKEHITHPLLEQRPVAKLCLLVITSDRGMAGSYNVNVLRKAVDVVNQLGTNFIKVITVGKKARAFFTKQGWEIAGHFAMPSSEVTFQEAKEIGQIVRCLFEEKHVDEVRIIYTRFYSPIRRRVTESRLLPIVPSIPTEEDKPTSIDFIFEPQPRALLGNLLLRFVDTEIYHAMLESLASEHGARMTAMDTATNNAAEMIQRLTLELHRARQAAITKELAEIVSAADALKGT